MQTTKNVLPCKTSVNSIFLKLRDTNIVSNGTLITGSLMAVGSTITKGTNKQIEK